MTEELATQLAADCALLMPLADAWVKGEAPHQKPQGEALLRLITWAERRDREDRESAAINWSQKWDEPRPGSVESTATNKLTPEENAELEQLAKDEKAADPAPSAVTVMIDDPDAVFNKKK